MLSGHSLMKVFDQFVDECIQKELQKEKQTGKSYRTYF